MATLQDIQGLVNQAQAKITDPRHVATILWPQIKLMLGQCTDLEWIYRESMSKLIYQWLNQQGLQGAPASINLNYLKGALIARQVAVPEPGQAYKWLPW